MVGLDDNSYLLVGGERGDYSKCVSTLLLREYVEVSECGWLNIHERREWLSKKTRENHSVASPPRGFHSFFWITTLVFREY